jgi:serine/threonine protein kinase
MGHQLTSQPSVSPGEIGHVLRDRYVLVDRLGSGDKGTIFKARDRYRADLPLAQQYVAIKVLHATAANHEELLANLRCEFYRMQTLSHQSIVNVFELDRDGDVDFYTMEFLDGELLSRVMGRLQPMPMFRPHAWAIIREIGSGLEYAHARNVVHGDLKPQNIMVTHSGEVRILGFGAPSIFSEQCGEDRRLRPKTAVSSLRPAYASCELLDGRPPDPRDDIYAFACLSYELLAGAHPFQRRRSTEARHLGIVPRRPLGLTRRQWQAFTTGLSWHRAGRSISVRTWLNRLDVGRASGRLPGARDIESEPVNPRPATSLRATAVFAGLLICVIVWLSVAHLSGKTISGHNVVPAVAKGTQLNPGPVPAPENAGPPGKPPAASAAMDAGPRNAPAAKTQSEPPEKQSQAEKNIRRDVNRSKLPMVSASDYRVRSGERFAEIRVHRFSRLSSDAPFMWWTEAATAKPGIDYVHQGTAIQSFPKGKSSTSFFVKLVPKSSRTQPQVFYIAIAEAGRDASSGQVARAAVWLPTNRDQS